VRVVSLLPAATEIVAALGDQSLLVGISHECDYPPSVLHLPRVTTTPIDIRASGSVIDAEVRRLYRAGQPVIAIDASVLQQLEPDLIITQDLCQICAVSDGQVHRLAAGFQSPPQVLALKARNLAGVWEDIRAVGAALELSDEAEELVLGLQTRLRLLAAEGSAHSPRVLCVEWLDPLYLAGHWVPELVAAAGGTDVGAAPNSRSVRAEWADIGGLQPECLLIMLCGFGIARSRTELERLTQPDALELMSRVPTWILDGNAYTSRPGPRLVDGVSRMWSAFHDRPIAGVERWAIAGACSV
jgi:iron complex transport system substrate-binding protein